MWSASGEAACWTRSPTSSLARAAPGAFSDGKLNTGTKDVRHRYIMEQLVACGAPEDILWDAKPHVGTDMLHIALKNMRNELTALGADIRFGHKLTGVSAENGPLSALTVEGRRALIRCPAVRRCWRWATAPGTRWRCCITRGWP